MEKEFVYIVREDMYGEWAWECGSTTILGVARNIDNALDMFRKQIIYESRSSDGDWLFELSDLIVLGKEIDDHINKYLEDVRSRMENETIFLDIYTNEHNYDNGENSGTIVIEKIELK